MKIEEILQKATDSEKSHCLAHGYKLSDDFLGSETQGRVFLATATEERIANNPRLNLIAEKDCMTKVSIKIVNLDCGATQLTNASKFVPSDIWFKNLFFGLPFITWLLDVFIGGKRIFLVNECVENGNLQFILDLFNVERRDGGFSEVRVRGIFQRLVQAVYCIHERNVALRDLRPESISLSSKLDLKIVDFTLANYVVDAIPKTEILNSTYVGSPVCLAPEIIQRKENCEDLKADCWSLGVILFVMVHGTPPFEAETISELEEVYDQEPSELDIQYREELTHDCKDLLKNLLKFNPTERLRVKAILNHPWLRHEPPDPKLNLPCVLTDKKRKAIRKQQAVEECYVAAYIGQRAALVNDMVETISKTKLVPDGLLCEFGLAITVQQDGRAEVWRLREFPKDDYLPQSAYKDFYRYLQPGFGLDLGIDKLSDVNFIEGTSKLDTVMRVIKKIPLLDEWSKIKKGVLSPRNDNEKWVRLCNTVRLQPIAAPSSPSVNKMPLADSKAIKFGNSGMVPPLDNAPNPSFGSGQGQSSKVENVGATLVKKKSIAEEINSEVREIFKSLWKEKHPAPGVTVDIGFNLDPNRLSPELVPDEEVEAADTSKKVVEKPKKKLPKKKPFWQMTKEEKLEEQRRTLPRCALYTPRGVVKEEKKKLPADPKPMKTFDIAKERKAEKKRTLPKCAIYTPRGMETADDKVKASKEGESKEGGKDHEQGGEELSYGHPKIVIKAMKSPKIPVRMLTKTNSPRPQIAFGYKIPTPRNDKKSLTAREEKKNPSPRSDVKKVASSTSLPEAFSKGNLKTKLYQKMSDTKLADSKVVKKASTPKAIKSSGQLFKNEKCGDISAKKNSTNESSLSNEVAPKGKDLNGNAQIAKSIAVITPSGSTPTADGLNEAIPADLSCDPLKKTRRAKKSEEIEPCIKKTDDVPKEKSVVAKTKPRKRKACSSVDKKCDSPSTKEVKGVLLTAPNRANPIPRSAKRKLELISETTNCDGQKTSAKHGNSPVLSTEKQRPKRKKGKRLLGDKKIVEANVQQSTVIEKEPKRGTDQANATKKVKSGVGIAIDVNRPITAVNEKKSRKYKRKQPYLRSKKPKEATSDAVGENLPRPRKEIKDLPTPAGKALGETIKTIDDENKDTLDDNSTSVVVNEQTIGIVEEVEGEDTSKDIISLEELLKQYDLPPSTDDEELPDLSDESTGDVPPVDKDYFTKLSDFPSLCISLPETTDDSLLDLVLTCQKQKNEENGANKDNVSAGVDSITGNVSANISEQKVSSQLERSESDDNEVIKDADDPSCKTNDQNAENSNKCSEAVTKPRHRASRFTYRKVTEAEIQKFSESDQEEYEEFCRAKRERNNLAIQKSLENIQIFGNKAEDCSDTAPKGNISILDGGSAAENEEIKAVAAASVEQLHHVQYENSPVLAIVENVETTSEVCDRVSNCDESVVDVDVSPKQEEIDNEAVSGSEAVNDAHIPVKRSSEVVGEAEKVPEKVENVCKDQSCDKLVLDVGSITPRERQVTDVVAVSELRNIDQPDQVPNETSPPNLPPVESEPKGNITKPFEGKTKYSLNEGGHTFARFLDLTQPFTSMNDSPRSIDSESNASTTSFSDRQGLTVLTASDFLRASKPNKDYSRFENRQFTDEDLYLMPDDEMNDYLQYKKIMIQKKREGREARLRAKYSESLANDARLYRYVSVNVLPENVLPPSRKVSAAGLSEVAVSPPSLSSKPPDKKDQSLEAGCEKISIVPRKSNSALSEADFEKSTIVSHNSDSTGSEKRNSDLHPDQVTLAYESDPLPFSSESDPPLFASESDPVQVTPLHPNQVTLACESDPPLLASESDPVQVTPLHLDEVTLAYESDPPLPPYESDPVQVTPLHLDEVTLAFESDPPLFSSESDPPLLACESDPVQVTPLHPNQVTLACESDPPLFSSESDPPLLASESDPVQVTPLHPNQVTLACESDPPLPASESDPIQVTPLHPDQVTLAYESDPPLFSSESDPPLLASESDPVQVTPLHLDQVTLDYESDPPLPASESDPVQVTPLHLDQVTLASESDPSLLASESDPSLLASESDPVQVTPLHPDQVTLASESDPSLLASESDPVQVTPLHLDQVTLASESDPSLLASESDPLHPDQVTPKQGSTTSKFPGILPESSQENDVINFIQPFHNINQSTAALDPIWNVIEVSKVQKGSVEAQPPDIIQHLACEPIVEKDVVNNQTSVDNATVSSKISSTDLSLDDSDQSESSAAEKKSNVTLPECSMDAEEMAARPKIQTTMPIEIVTLFSNFDQLSSEKPSNTNINLDFCATPLLPSEQRNAANDEDQCSSSRPLDLNLLPSPPITAIDKVTNWINEVSSAEYINSGKTPAVSKDGNDDVSEATQDLMADLSRYIKENSKPSSDENSIVSGLLPKDKNQSRDLRDKKNTSLSSKGSALSNGRKSRTRVKVKPESHTPSKCDRSSYRSPDSRRSRREFANKENIKKNTSLRISLPIDIESDHLETSFGDISGSDKAAESKVKKERCIMRSKKSIERRVKHDKYVSDSEKSFVSQTRNEGYSSQSEASVHSSVKKEKYISGSEKSVQSQTKLKNSRSKPGKSVRHERSPAKQDSCQEDRQPKIIKTEKKKKSRVSSDNQERCFGMAFPGSSQTKKKQPFEEFLDSDSSGASSKSFAIDGASSIASVDTYLMESPSESSCGSLQSVASPPRRVRKQRAPKEEPAMSQEQMQHMYEIKMHEIAIERHRIQIEEHRIEIEKRNIKMREHCIEVEKLKLKGFKPKKHESEYSPVPDQCHSQSRRRPHVKSKKVIRLDGGSKGAM